MFVYELSGCSSPVAVNDCFWTLLIQSRSNNRKNTGTHSETIIRDVFRTQWNIWDVAFCRNSWLCLTVDYFCKTLHIICFRRLWICLQLNKILVYCHLFHKKLGLQSLDFFFLIQFYLHLISLPWDINHKFKTRVFHFKLIHLCTECI